MDAYRLHVKLYLETGDGFAQESLIPIFHRWIRDRELGDELLIDVADYKHVPDGPGVMLIGHEAHYAVDEQDGRPGLVYARKRPGSGSFGERLRAAFGQALKAARKLEAEPSLAGLKVAGDRLAVRIDDRMLAPDSDETFAAIEPELRALLAELYGGVDFRLQREEVRGGRFGVQVEADAGPGAAALLARMAATDSVQTSRSRGQEESEMVFPKPDLGEIEEVPAEEVTRDMA